MKAALEPYRCALGFRGLTVEINSNVSPPLVWIEEFMSPALSAKDKSESRREIRLIVDEHRFAQILSLTRAAEGESVDCFTKDGSFEQLKAWRDEQCGRILHFEMGECFLLPDSSDGTIELIARTDSGMMRRCLMRLVRELAMIQALYQGDVFIHGAAVVCRDQAILVTGARRSGKTTMLINALRQGNTCYLANDRVFVERSGNGFVARGMPTIVTVRPDSLSRLPGLKLPRWGYPWRHYLTLRECEEGSDLIRPPFQEPPSMNPPQFCRWLGAPMLAQAPLRAVVFPQIDPSVTGYSLQRHTQSEGVEKLCSNIFWAGATGPVAKTFAQGWNGSPPDLESLKNGCADISNHCAMISCRLGPAAFESPNVWDAIVSAAFEGQ